ncbi:MAG: extracellular solute-binding protein [Terricaulis silvestris]
MRFWAMGNEAAAVPNLLKAFDEANPGTRVDVQALPWSAAHEKLLTAYAGRALPDVAQIGNTWVTEMTAIGALTPLPEAHNDLLPDNFPGVLETNRIGERYYALPWYVDTRLLYYRTDMLARAGYRGVPSDWDEWKRAMHAVKRIAGAGNYAMLMPLNEFELLLTLGLQQDEPLLRDEGGRGNFSNLGFIHALEFYKSCFDEQLAPVVTAAQISNIWFEFARGFFSIFFSGPWTVGDLRTRLPDAFQSKWNTSAMPGPKSPGASAAGGSSVAVLRSARDPDAAWRLVRYLLSRDAQAAFNEETGDLPARVSAWSAPALRQDRQLAAFSSQLARAKAVPKVAEWERIVTEMQTVAERMVRGEYTPVAAAAEIDARADRLLEKRRWMLERGRAV